MYIESTMTTPTETRPAFTIFANGIDMGSFPGFDEREALDTYARHLGYADLHEMADVLSKTVAELRAELVAVEEKG
jgi:hypothetical protein